LAAKAAVRVPVEIAAPCNYCSQSGGFLAQYRVMADTLNDCAGAALAWLYRSFPEAE
jgi:hypothetical protein